MTRNLLLITFDQLRADWADPFNSKWINLKNLQYLAKKGVTVERCYTTSPQCVPSRLSWLTGKMPSTNGVTRNISCSIRDTIPTIFHDVQNQGWHTEIIGKTHWTSHRKETDLRETEALIKKAGFNHITEIAGPRALQRIRCELTDKWEEKNLYDIYRADLKERYGRGRTQSAWAPRPSCLPNNLYPDIWIANQAVNSLRKLKSGDPWVLWVSFIGPHEPFDTPKNWSVKLNKNYPEPINRIKWITELEESIELKKNYLKWKNLLSKSEINDLRNDYANNIGLLDQQVGKVIGTLKKREDCKDTDIVVTSDHGEMLGDYNMLYKSTFLEPAIRVPMIISCIDDDKNYAKRLEGNLASIKIIKK